MEKSCKMPTYEVVVRDNRHQTVSCYAFCSHSEAMDFYCAEKKAIEQWGRNSGLTVSEPAEAV